MLNNLILRTIPLMPKSLVKIFSKRYIAGEQIDAAVKVSLNFVKKGAKTTIDVLGEFVSDKQSALKERGWSEEVIKTIEKHQLQTYLSVKPTSIGLGLDFDFGYENIKYLVSLAKEKNQFVRLDMENSPYTTQTLDAYKKLRSEGFDNVGIVIQAYLHRSHQDILELLAYNANIRLCKGIYVEDPSITYKDKQQIRDNYTMLLRVLLENGHQTHIATHDDELIENAKKIIAELNIPKNQYEFEMLLGVREHKRDELLAQGHPVRIYVPFGEDWYGYSVRRLHENPEMAMQIVKAIFVKS